MLDALRAGRARVGLVALELVQRGQQRPRLAADQPQHALATTGLGLELDPGLDHAVGLGRVLGTCPAARPGRRQRARRASRLTPSRPFDGRDVPREGDEVAPVARLAEQLGRGRGVALGQRLVELRQPLVDLGRDRRNGGGGHVSPRAGDGAQDGLSLNRANRGRCWISASWGRLVHMLSPSRLIERSSRRLSALDASFLRMESSEAHMHVGWSAVFEPAEGRRRPTLAALRDRVAGRLDQLDWCRWRLQSAPLGLSEPRWVRDDKFDLEAHVRALSRPAEGLSYERFADLRDDAFSQPLDLRRAPWEICMVPRLADGRMALVGKIHHSLVDGIAALQIVGLIVDEPEQGSDGAEPSDEGGRAAPSTTGPLHPVAWAADEAALVARAGLGAARAVAGAAIHPLDAAGGAVRGARGFLRRRAPTCSPGARLAAGHAALAAPHAGRLPRGALAAARRSSRRGRHAQRPRAGRRRRRGPELSRSTATNQPPSRSRRWSR